MGFGAVYFRPLGGLLPLVDGRELHLSSQDGGEGRSTALKFQHLLPAEMWRALAVSGPVGIADGAGFDRGGAVCNRQTEAGRNWTPYVLALQFREKKNIRTEGYPMSLIGRIQLKCYTFYCSGVERCHSRCLSTKPFEHCVCTKDRQTFSQMQKCKSANLKVPIKWLEGCDLISNVHAFPFRQEVRVMVC